MAALSTLVFGNVGCGQQDGKDTSSALQGVKQELKNAELKAETDFDKALDRAKKEGKILMLEFVGSKWCPPCMMMKKFVVDTEKFANYAKDKLVNVVADFDRQGNPLCAEQAKKHLDLIEKYAVRGFPTTVIIDPSTGRTESITGLAFDTPDGLIEFIEKFKASPK